MGRLICLSPWGESTGLVRSPEPQPGSPGLLPLEFLFLQGKGTQGPGPVSPSPSSPAALGPCDYMSPSRV